MNLQDIQDSFIEAHKVLETFIANEQNWVRIAQSGDIMAEAIMKGKKVISCGNGGSMSDAMHFAEELTGRFRNDRQGMAAMAISDPTHITCVGNDYGFDYIFSRYVEAMGQTGDVLFAISTSGNSKNILHAAKEAQKEV